MKINNFYKTLLILTVTSLVTMSAVNINSYAADNTGTFTKGGIFTSEVRAFLDAIAKEEAEGDYLSLSSYNSGNFDKNDFDAFASTDVKPKLKSGGYKQTKYGTNAWNIGRYQYYSGEYTMGDINSGNLGLKLAGIDFTISNFHPTSQDHYPIGKYAARAKILKKDTLNLHDVLTKGEAGLMEAIGVASGEWASFPYVPGYKHADSAQARWNIQGLKTYYYDRVWKYNQEGGESTEVKGDVKEEVKTYENMTEQPLSYKPKTITFKSKLNQDKCLDLNLSKAEDYNKIQIWKCNDTDAQKWVLGKNPDADSYQIKSMANTKFCIDADSYSPTLSSILIYCTNANTQWVISNEGQLKPTINESLCLSLSKSSTKNGQSLILQTCNGTSAQTWIF
jgi:Ricin-type beta-trefoil lectin domain